MFGTANALHLVILSLTCGKMNILFHNEVVVIYTEKKRSAGISVSRVRAPTKGEAMNWLA